jgi:hypothetical protein
MQADCAVTRRKVFFVLTKIRAGAKEMLSAGFLLLLEEAIRDGLKKDLALRICRPFKMQGACVIAGRK